MIIVAEQIAKKRFKEVHSFTEEQIEAAYQIARGMAQHSKRKLFVFLKDGNGKMTTLKRFKISGLIFRKVREA